MNEVALLINNQRLSGWKSVSVSRSMDAVAGSFDLRMVDAWFDKESPLEPSVSCIVQIDGIPVVTGFVDSANIVANKDENSLSMKGRCKTGDLVDCSIISEKSTWNNKDLISIIREIVNPFEISVVNELTDTGEKLRSVTINDGEAPFELIDRLCKERGVLALGDPKGNLTITSAGKTRAVDNLIYGKNVLSAEVSYEFTNRFSWYIVKGQSNSNGDGWGKEAIKISGEAIDTGVSRYRPKVITADNDTSRKRVQQRAEWEALNRAGRSVKVVVHLQGWKQSDNSLWKENLTVYCDLPNLRIKGDMLINQVDYSQGDEGTLCTMQLVRADCYESEPPKQIKSKKSKVKWGGW